MSVVIFFAVLAVGLWFTSRNKQQPTGPIPLQEQTDLSIAPAGEPAIISLRIGDELTFSVDCHSITREVLTQMMAPAIEGTSSRPIRVRMARDYQSQISDAIKVDTGDGQPLGSIAPTDRALAYILLSSITTVMPEHEPSIKGRQIILDVAAQVTGEWQLIDGSLRAKLTSLDIHVKDPAEADIETS